MRWTNLQAVVSKGANPLPAEVRIKQHTNKEIAKNIYFVDHNKWESTGVATQREGTANTFRFKTYADPIQEQVRRMVGRSLIFTFGLYVYEEDIDRKNFVLKLPLPRNACIGSVLTIVNNEKDRCVLEINMRILISQRFFGTGFLPPVSGSRVDSLRNNYWACYQESKLEKTGIHLVQI